ncbi:MAG TPA: hypothetical protein VMK12_26675 [Anaeromyxobacteraceae bacterium]|nr:hypothetical protein [Anaeromyxobacteraceae bacterium]
MRPIGYLALVAGQKLRAFDGLRRSLDKAPPLKAAREARFRGVG